MSIVTTIKRLWNPEKDAQELYKKVSAQRKRIMQLRKDYKSLESWNTQYLNTIGLITESMQALIWKKDHKSRYLLANPIHCEKFFGFDSTPECLKAVIGRTDKELIDMAYKDDKTSNTFGEVCVLSDQYARNQVKPVHFLEAGMVDGKELLLYMIKTPQFSNTKKLVSVIGIAWDFTKKSQFMMDHLNRWIYDNQATKLYHNKEVFCYVLASDMAQCDIFNHICPFPKRGKECTKLCDDCKGVHHD